MAKIKRLKRLKPLKKIRYRLCFNHARRLNKRGEGLVQVVAQQGRNRAYFSTGVHVSPRQWCDVSQMVVSDTDGHWAAGVNYALAESKRRIEMIELEYIRQGKDMTLAMLKEAHKECVSPAEKLRDFGISVIGKSDRSDLTKGNYTTLLNNIDRFRKNVHINDIDYQWLADYDSWLRTQDIAHNTRISRLRMLRALLNEALHRELIDSNPFERFKIQSMRAKRGYVSADKLAELESLKLTGREEKVMDAFLLACYTGLRFSDIISLRSAHLCDGWITKLMVKTKLTVHIPYARLFDGKAARLIDKWGCVENLVMDLGGNAAVNRILHDMFELHDMPTKITFHSSRHTFATLLLQKGVELSVVQAMLGHTKITTTQVYSEVDRETILQNIK